MATVAAGKELSVSQAVPLRPEDRRRLRIAAADAEVGPGLLARALILAGLDMLDDPRMRSVLEGEIAAERARLTAAGRAAMAQRWHGTNGDDETDEVER